MSSDKKICVAKILTAHGVRGLVKLRCFLSDASLFSGLRNLTSDRGQVFEMTLKNPMKGDWIAEIKGITDRTEAEKLRGLSLFVDRSQIVSSDELLESDLIGFAVFDKSKNKIGTIEKIENFGAGDLLLIRPLNGKNFYLPMREPYFVQLQKQDQSIIIDEFAEFVE